MGTLFFLYISLFIYTTNPLLVSPSKLSDTLPGGSSLSVEKLLDVLTSPNGVFSAGFFPIGVNAHCFGIWFNEPSRAVVWTANRDSPVNGKRSRLILLESGNLILTDGGLSTTWATKTASRAPAKLRLHDSGNMVLLASDGVLLWQSFDSPTDTILPEQQLTRYTKLVSSRSTSNVSSGFYRFFFDTDNVLRLTFDNNVLSSVYWPFPWFLIWNAGRSTYNNSKIAVLDSLGGFSSSDDFKFKSADYGAKIQRRLKLDHDGNARLYSWNAPEEKWVVTWQAFSNPCRIHGICGSNSLCLYTRNGRKCSCVQGYKMRNRTDWSYGCEPEFKPPSCGGQNDSAFVRISNAEYFGYDYGIYSNYTLRDCKNLCSSICGCKGFQFSFNAAEQSYRCHPKMMLNNGYRRPGFSNTVYIRLPKSQALSHHGGSSEVFGLNCSDKRTMLLARLYRKRQTNESVKFVSRFACGVGGIEALCVLLVWCLLIRNRQKSSVESRVYTLAMTGFRRFSFVELKKATKNFSEEIGRGSGGVVFKGILPDSRVAAIKRLSEACQGEAEYLAEVNSIGKLNHMNLIEMWGYCAEGKHRLLVYEYMELGSLKGNINNKALDSDKRFEIAKGVARGLAYLHEECLEWVLHCDVKPQNILLNSDYQPKVADFGLSKLLKRGEFNDPSFSRMRGTRGYMAPEWVTNKSITSKVDVYSYGVVLLEMMTGRSPIFDEGNGSARETQSRGLVRWVREVMNSGSIEMGWSSCLDEIMDSSMEGRYEKDKMGILLNVALNCVEEDKDWRPTMRQVVEALQDYHK